MKRDGQLDHLMAAPDFPCRRVSFSSPIENSRDIIGHWLKIREGPEWVLLSGEALVSDVQCWVAYEVLLRNQERGVMKSNSLDGEFLRLISGTHHISEAFRRAGLVDGDTAAWLVHLGGNEVSNFSSHAEAMGFELTDERPSPELSDIRRLGIIEGEGEDVAIGHIHLADLR